MPKTPTFQLEFNFAFPKLIWPQKLFIDNTYYILHTQYSDKNCGK
jgi:hypothetical protein